MTIRVRCIQDNFYPAGPATIMEGKVYEAVESTDKLAWLITDDFGQPLVYMSKHRFEVLEPVENPFDRCPIAPGKYIVLCRGDRTPDGEKGKFQLASSDGFGTPQGAERYRDTICPTREPHIALVS